MANKPPVLRGFTPIQMKILELLADGERHARKEVMGCLNDELGHSRNIYPHVKVLRERLRAYGQYVVCELSGREVYYRRVILLRPST